MEIAIALLTLVGLEIVLGIDNLVFISILASKLPPEQQAKARMIGLSLAMVTRVILLLSISWVMGLTETLFSLMTNDFSGRDLVLLGGGAFLVIKATWEIHEKLEGKTPIEQENMAAEKFGLIVTQIAFLDIIFSLDSVITAIGMAKDVWVMIVAVVISMIFMMVFSGAVSRFIEKHPTMKILALAFLILIGVTLMMEGWGAHISKGYIYVAMGFALGVEFINIRIRKQSRPVRLHGTGANNYY